MATTSFIAFLLIAYFLTTQINPKSKTEIWLYSALIPLSLLALTSFLVGNSTYEFGEIAGQCLISSLCAMGLMFYLFSEKFKKEKS